MVRNFLLSLLQFVFGLWVLHEMLVVFGSLGARNVDGLKKQLDTFREEQLI